MSGFDYEKLAWDMGFRLIAGVDEVGRGPLAGHSLPAQGVPAQPKRHYGCLWQKYRPPNSQVSYWWHHNTNMPGIFLDIPRKIPGIPTFRCHT